MKHINIFFEFLTDGSSPSPKEKLKFPNRFLLTAVVIVCCSLWGFLSTLLKDVHTPLYFTAFRYLLSLLSTKFWSILCFWILLVWCFRILQLVISILVEYPNHSLHCLLMPELVLCWMYLLWYWCASGVIYHVQWDFQIS